ncbi:hypothetical protein [Candidatus Poriferisodalis sp.]|uniref:hypothetical protein n=1 Tax=Candidatus Poriferisodalis sp. TaxID=3101277 RepID=UPI003B027EEA
MDIDRFRRWVLGDLVDNRNRGLFAEWLVGEALGVIDARTPRREWDAYDLMYRETKIEVKASGRSQSWSQDQPSKIRFGIDQNVSSWTAASGEWIPHSQPLRFADVYVFCLPEPVPASNANVADPEYWTFWVVATDVLDHELGSQKSLGIRTLNRLTSSVTWTGIRARVDACAETRRAN